jgi:hypothetical protein
MCIATMKTMTRAVKARSVLEGRGIRAEIVSLDPSLTRYGCSYGIRFPCEEETRALRFLEEKNIPWGTVLGTAGRDSI